MSFAGVTKSVGKIQKFITYWLSMILIWFFHFGKVDYDSFRQVGLIVIILLIFFVIK
jgi:hypothetical protein